MSLYETIQADLKEAMKSGDAMRRDTLRMVIAAIKNKAIDTGGDRSAMDDEAVLGVLLNAVKSRTDSAEQYEAAGRAELASKERSEIEVIQGYLPKQLSEADTRELVQTTIAEVGAESKKDLGKVMKAIMASHKGQVDGKLLQRLLGEMLG
ncbi:MAG TPA: GatB/YqeY domain-containing protein [Planctomycetota bacterium]|nr:GatB/YqeY domain-containing protein [Planctomycetota bacterium]HPF13471.1 GatB/YqeY domain-containing protein [Planctomycetota bacterium]HRV80327.1 GatB/YqeY domain-containing protein [Planctomycetota bacterium]